MEQIPSTTQEVTEDTVTLKRSHFYAVLVVFAFTVGILFGYVLWGRPNQAQQAVQAQAQQPAAQAPAAPTQDPAEFTRYDVPTEGYPSLGPDDAEIVIVEFSDYQ